MDGPSLVSVDSAGLAEKAIIQDAL